MEGSHTRMKGGKNGDLCHLVDDATVGLGKVAKSGKDSRLL